MTQAKDSPKATFLRKKADTSSKPTSNDDAGGSGFKFNFGSDEKS